MKIYSSLPQQVSKQGRYIHPCSRFLNKWIYNHPCRKFLNKGRYIHPCSRFLNKWRNILPGTGQCGKVSYINFVSSLKTHFFLVYHENVIRTKFVFTSDWFLVPSYEMKKRYLFYLYTGFHFCFISTRINLQKFGSDTSETNTQKGETKSKKKNASKRYKKVQHGCRESHDRKFLDMKYLTSLCNNIVLSNLCIGYASGNIAGY